ncbi:Mitochondria protein Fmp29, partial [Penicillium freii]
RHTITRSILSAPYLQKPLTAYYIYFLPQSPIYQSTSIPSPAKQYNKTIALILLSLQRETLTNRKVIARIPTPITGPPYYTTASKVATINFLRSILKLPVPEVLAYLVLSDNPISAEYILIKQIKGEKDFCISPISAQQFWHSKQSKPEIDRLSPKDYIISTARREIAIIQYHTKAQPRQTFLLPTNHNILPSKHTSLLSRFLQLAPYIIRPDSYSIPTLRHPDLSLSNILLAPRSTKIIRCYDIPPLYISRLSRILIYILSLPDDFNKIGIEQQRQYKAVFRLEEANIYYTATIGIHNKEYIDLLRLPYLGIQQYLLRQTGISSATCPVIFSDKEQNAAINKSEQLLSQIREHLDIDIEGGTEPDNFKRAVEGNQEFRIKIVRQAEVDQQELY